VGFEQGSQLTDVTNEIAKGSNFIHAAIPAFCGRWHPSANVKDSKSCEWVTALVGAAGIIGYCFCQIVQTIRIGERGPKQRFAAAMTWGTIMVLAGVEAAGVALGIPGPFLGLFGYFTGFQFN